MIDGAGEDIHLEKEHRLIKIMLSIKKLRTAFSNHFLTCEFIKNICSLENFNHLIISHAMQN